MSSISPEELFVGAPYQLGNICKIHQLKLKEILDREVLGFEKYYYFVNLLTMEEEDLKEVLTQKAQLGNIDISIFQYILLSAASDKTFFLDLKKALSTFIKEEVMISPKTGVIIVGDPKDKRVIGEKEFGEINLALRLFNKLRIKEPPPENETPMQRKFRLKREERDRVKEKQNAKKGDLPSFADVMSSVCVMNTGITALNIGEYTIYQIKDLLERAQAKETYHTELDMLCAGADSKKIKPKHYVRNLQKEVN